MAESTVPVHLELQVLCMVVLLISCIVFTHMMEVKKFWFLHESAFSIFVGILGSVILTYAGVIEDLEFNAESFFAVILPPIIFAAGYNLRKQEFFDNLKYILLYGVLGTFINFTAITAMGWSISQTNIFIDKNTLSLADFMLMACVLASTDTVAALTLVKPEKYPKLNAILFGEGVVNDAVSILLFNTVKTTLVGEDISGKIVLQIAGNFIYLSFVSIFLGVSFALVLAFSFKKFHTFSEAPMIETCLVILVGYSSYLLPEILHLSGIMSLFSCGMVLSHYAFQNLSETSQKGTALTFDALSFLAETFVFMYLGATVTYVDIGEFPWLFTLMMIVVVFVARILAVFLPPAIYYIIRRKEINLLLKELKVICYGGLVRGAIAFALAYKIAESGGEDAELKNKTILNVALGVVLFTTFALTMMLKTFSKYIGLDQTDDLTLNDFKQFLIAPIESTDGSTHTDSNKKPESEQGIEFTVKNILHSNTTISSPSNQGRFKKQWKFIEEKIMIPVFVKGDDSSHGIERTQSMTVDTLGEATPSMKDHHAKSTVFEK